VAREVDVAPAQRDQLATAQTREGGRDVDRGVLLAAGRAHEREYLLG
jgi:hypothetical protein